MPPKKSKKNETPPPSNQGKKPSGARRNIVKSGNAGSNKNTNDQVPSPEKVRDTTFLLLLVFIFIFFPVMRFKKDIRHRLDIKNIFLFLLLYT